MQRLFGKNVYSPPLFGDIIEKIIISVSAMYTKEQIEDLLNPWPLSWISREDLTACVQNVVKRSNKLKPDKENIIDPFSALFDMAITGMNYKEWRISERRRQQQKTLQNAIGDFHQEVIGFIKGWQNQKVGRVIDVINPTEKIYAEIKNKFNTIKASDRDKVFRTMLTLQSKAGKYEGYTCYLVEILCKSHFDKEFTPSSNITGTTATGLPTVREIDGVTFLAKVTGSPTAFQDLHNTLPLILQLVVPTFDAKSRMADPMFKEFLAQAVKYDNR